jgi:2-polyprenyl-3-methyl-5-hydroxy-6-metoxy-1,4-benzoquinol methylase
MACPQDNPASNAFDASRVPRGETGLVRCAKPGQAIPLIPFGQIARASLLKAAMTQQAEPERYGDRLFHATHPAERERLDLLAQAWNPASCHHLETLALQPGWRCLDVGAGAGEISHHLAHAVAPGEVIALDRDTSYLQPQQRGNINVLTADITDESLDLGQFDLIHARCVLMHLRDREAVLARLVSWLRPGGLLLLSDTAELGFPSSPNPDFRAVMTALSQAIAINLGSDQDYGRRYPVPLLRNGLTDIRMTIDVPVVTSAAPITGFWRLTLEQARQDMVGTGLVDNTTIDRSLAYLNDPGTHDLSIALISCSGRRP